MSNNFDVMSRLVDYHDHIAAPQVPVADDLHRGRRRVRRNRNLLAGGVALGLASVIAVASLFTSQREADRPQPVGPTGLTTPLVEPQSLMDVRELGFRVEPAEEFTVSGSWAVDLSLDQQGTSVVFVDNGLELGVAVYFQGTSAELPSAGTREEITVHGDAGIYAEEIRSDYWEAHLVWEYAPDSWAEVSGRGTAAPPSDLRSRFLSVAEALRSGGTPVRVPVRFGAVPDTLPAVAEAFSVSVSDSGGEWLWWLSIGDISLWAESAVGGDCLGSDGSPQTDEFSYGGHQGCVVAGERVGVQQDNGDVFFDYGPMPDLPLADMKRLLADMTVASDDRATWFDLRTSLGG